MQNLGRFYFLLTVFASGLGFCASASAQCVTNVHNNFSMSRFEARDDGTVVDTQTALVWKRCAEGYEWKSGQCLMQEGAQGRFTWSQALVYADGYGNFAGQEGWRLPNKNELNSIVERACFQPALDEQLFPSTPSAIFWTNTASHFNYAFAWAVNFDYGAHISTRRTNENAIRLVRDY